MYLTAKVYADERNGQLPDTLDDLAALIVRDTDYPLENWLYCPGVSQGGVSNGRYEYNPRASLGSHNPMIWDRQGNHLDGRNVLFADGKVEWVTESAFQEIRTLP
jgi:prepilin-type processing-associated H-X9-DG protein